MPFQWPSSLEVSCEVKSEDTNGGSFDPPEKGKGEPRETLGKLAPETVEMPKNYKPNFLTNFCDTTENSDPTCDILVISDSEEETLP